MEWIYGIIAGIVIVVLMGSWNKCPPMPKCKPPKRVRAVDGGFVAIDDIKAGDFLVTETAYNPGDLFCYGDEGMCGNYWGCHLLEDRDSGRVREVAVYKDGVRCDLGEFDTIVDALEAAIEKMEGSTSPQDENTTDQLKIWMAEVIKKVN